MAIYEALIYLNISLLLSKLISTINDTLLTSELAALSFKNFIRIFFFNIFFFFSKIFKMNCSPERLYKFTGFPLLHSVTHAAEPLKACIEDKP